MLAVFGVALAVRLIHLWAIRHDPVFDVLLGDARSYDAWARRLAGGDWVGTDVFYQAPLYPYLLGAVYAVAGHSLLAARLIQAVMGAAAATLLASAGTRLFSRRIGLTAGLGLALYAPAVFFDGLLQKSSLDLFLTCLLIWVSSRLIEHPLRTPAWLGLGATLGALSLTRENALALILVAMAWALGHRRPAHAGWRTVAGHGPALALVLGLVLTLAPVAARNYLVTGGFYLTTSQFGPNFYIGNNPEADGTYMSLRSGRGAPEFERQDATDLAEAALGRTLTPGEVSTYWTDQALAFITGEPGRWLALQARKFALLWNRSEMLDTESQETYEDLSPVLRALATAGHFGLLVPLALVGTAAAWPDRRRLWPLLALPSAYAASVLAFYVFARYRLPLAPFLVLFAAVGVWSARTLFVGASRRGRATLAGALVLVTIGVNRPLLSSSRMRAITETNLGAAFQDAGRPEEAVARYRKALAWQPDHVPALNNLGVALRALGRDEEAIAVYRQALTIDPAYPELHFNLANALLARGHSTEAEEHFRAAASRAPGEAGAHNNLGMTLAARGRYAEAAAAFRAAIAADPRSVSAHRNLASVLASAGQVDEACTVLERAIELDPRDADAAYDLGTLLLEMGRHADAAARFESVLAINPGDARTLNNLGIALGSQGRLREAIARFEQALAIDPGFQDARRNLATARAAESSAPPPRPRP